MQKWILGALVTAVMWMQGLGLELSDDEAYYWVLSRTLDASYAYHPPAVAGLIRLFAGDARLCAAILCGVVTFLVAWLAEGSAVSGRRLKNSVLVWVSFAGFTALAWMMVPDVPLILGWFLAFAGCRVSSGLAARGALVFVGVCLATLSKYSGVLIAVSVVLWSLSLDRQQRRVFVGAAVTAVILAALPILIWNARHEWGSLLYQFRDRHQGSSYSLMRGLKSWAIQLLIVGPALFVTARAALFGSPQVLSRWGWSAAEQTLVRAFALPAGVYLVQPFYSDFKPHWALVFWIPFVVALSWSAGRGQVEKWVKWHSIWGLSLIGLVWFSSHVPVQSWFFERVLKKPMEAKWDATNDFYGWGKVADAVQARLSPEALELPVLGSWYQTASRLAAVWPYPDRVARIPRQLSERDEWPEIPAVDGTGPAWPRLRSRVLFVADNRYAQSPEFPFARCEVLVRVPSYRGSYLAKEITVWDCRPQDESGTP